MTDNQHGHNLVLIDYNYGPYLFSVPDSEPKDWLHIHKDDYGIGARFVEDVMQLNNFEVYEVYEFDWSKWKMFVFWSCWGHLFYINITWISVLQFQITGTFHIFDVNKAINLDFISL